MKINVFELSEAFSAEQFLIGRFINNFRIKKYYGMRIKNDRKMLMLANELELTKNVFVAGQKKVETNFSKSESDKNMSNIIELIVQKTYNIGQRRDDDK